MSREATRALLRGKQNNRCCYCGNVMTRWRGGTTPRGGLPATSETIEHLRRRIDGGTNQPDNLALSCFGCNTGRGSIDWLTYKSLKMGELAVIP